MQTDDQTPRIVITPSESAADSVRLACCPVTLNPLDPDTILTVREYHGEDGRLLHTLTAHSYGPILFENEEIVEVHRSVVSDFRVIRREIHWLSRCGEMIRFRLRDLAESETVSLSTVDFIDMQFPVVLVPGYSAERRVRYVQGDTGASETFHDAVTGQYTLSIESDSFPCLRLTTTREGTSGRRVDTYIDMQTGVVKYAEMFEHDTRVAVQVAEIVASEKVSGRAASEHGE